MIKFRLNGENISFDGDPEKSLLNFLRNDQLITSVKDGCSGQAACGACLVEINGKAKLSCTSKIKNLNNAKIVTLEGVPEEIKNILAKAFVKQGAVQCGFCTPGILMHTKILFQDKKNPSRDEIKKALNVHLCRCTGFIKIIEAIEQAAETLRTGSEIVFKDDLGRVGTSLPKYTAIETALGKRPFINDVSIEGMLHASLKFSEFPRAKVLKIDTTDAEELTGVVKVFTANDIPGNRKTGLIFNDWPLMIGENEITNYIGDVIVGVVAETKEIANKAVDLIKVEYEELTTSD